MSADEPAITGPRRAWLFWVFSVLCAVGVVMYVSWRVRSTAPDHDPVARAALDPASPDRIDAVRATPHVVFRSMRGSIFGSAGVVPAADPARDAVWMGGECERLYAQRDVGLCMSLNRVAMQPRAWASIVDSRFQTRHNLPLAGIPIRARISRDQRYAAATVFVTGENYVSDFTTRTTLIDLASGRAIADLEQFATERDGRPFRQIDFNFWGVTFFNDSNRFYATLGTGGQRFLVEGDIASRRMRVVRSGVECPSLSPDERRVVFKRRNPGGKGWRLFVWDRAGDSERPVTSPGRSIDDQAEWLDNEHVLYAIQEDRGLPEVSVNIWMSAVSPESGVNEQMFLKSASSPAVVR